MVTKYFGVPFANSGDKTSIPDASQPSGVVSFEDGWTPDYAKDQVTDPSAKDIPRQSENYFKFTVTEALKEIQEVGFKPYSALVNYPVGAFTPGSDNILYKCLINNGPATTVVDPVGDVTGTWESAINVPDASEIEKGIIQIATTPEAEARTDDTKALTPKKGNELVAARRVVILAFGTYTSGTFTIPGSRVWTDFERVEVLANSLDTLLTRTSGSGFVTQEFITAHPTSWEIVTTSGSPSESVTVTAINSTQFSVSRSSNDSLRQVIGVLK